MFSDLVESIKNDNYKHNINIKYSTNEYANIIIARNFLQFSKKNDLFYLSYVTLNASDIIFACSICCKITHCKMMVESHYMMYHKNTSEINCKHLIVKT